MTRLQRCARTITIGGVPIFRYHELSHGEANTSRSSRRLALARAYSVNFSSLHLIPDRSETALVLVLAKMRVAWLFYNAFTFLLYPALLATAILYVYPAMFGCAFPVPAKPQAACFLEPQQSHDPTVQTTKAPFRLLVLADPQLEGDSSLPDAEELSFPALKRALESARSGDFDTGVRSLLNVFSKDIPTLLYSYRKQLDLFGNDYYLAHIYRSVKWWTQPTHVTVLGDLVGSQWIVDEEFERRGSRFWNRVFKGGMRVEDSITDGENIEVLGVDKDWAQRVINVAGNHDIGYAGDITQERMDRFERVFGPANWVARFELPNTTLESHTSSMLNPFAENHPPELRLVVLNSMNLDNPAYDTKIQTETYEFLNKDVILRSRPVEDRKIGTILLTHIPLHKREGVCEDGTFFDYSDRGVKEQNHISENSGRGILEGIFGLSKSPSSPNKGKGRNGIILAGHDHRGCDVYHHVQRPTDADNTNSDPSWIAEHSVWDSQRWENAAYLAEDSTIPGVREITVRSMMGEFGGNAGMLSAWFDDEEGEWNFEYASCRLGVQHFWWAVHVADVIVGLLGLAWIGCALRERGLDKREAALAKAQEKQQIQTPNHKSGKKGKS